MIPIIVMRSKTLWMKLIPELENIENKIIVLKNPRNPVISLNNIKDEKKYRAILRILQA